MQPVALIYDCFCIWTHTGTSKHTQTLLSCLLSEGDFELLRREKRRGKTRKRDKSELNIQKQGREEDEVKWLDRARYKVIKEWNTLQLSERQIVRSKIFLISEVMEGRLHVQGKRKWKRKREIFLHMLVATLICVGLTGLVGEIMWRQGSVQRQQKSIWSKRKKTDYCIDSHWAHS